MVRSRSSISNGYPEITHGLFESYAFKMSFRKNDIFVIFLQKDAIIITVKIVGGGARVHNLVQTSGPRVRYFRCAYARGRRSPDAREKRE